MKNIKLGTRLALCFGAIGLIMTVACLVGIAVMGDLGGAVESVATRSMPNAMAALKWEVALQETARNMRTLLLVSDDERSKRLTEQIAEGAKKRAALAAALEKSVGTAEGRALLAKVEEVRARLVPLENEYLKLMADKRREPALAMLLDKLRPVQLDAMQALEAFSAFEEKLALKEAEAARAEARHGVLALSAALALALLVTVAVAILATRSITRPLKATVEFADRIAAGDLRAEITVDRKDEIGTLVASLSAMRRNLANLVREIQAHAGEVSSAASDLAGTAEQVAQSSENQSEAAAAMAASVEQMTVSIGHISESADSANARTAESGSLSASSRDVVEKSGAEMAQIATSIGESAELVKTLQEQSREISTIADVIKNIAEQTNLLALNAAIEAARAGESGRGFAVVADAVRELAERTGRSTAEIGVTIAKVQERTDQVFANMHSAVERVNSGLTLSRQAGEAIHKVSAAAGQVTASVNEISNALKEQSQASNAIAAHVERIAQMAEENSGAVAHAKEAARGLQGLSTRLQSTVMRFTV